MPSTGIGMPYDDVFCLNKEQAVKREAPFAWRPQCQGHRGRTVCALQEVRVWAVAKETHPN